MSNIYPQAKSIPIDYDFLVWETNIATLTDNKDCYKDISKMDYLLHDCLLYSAVIFGVVS